MKTTYWQEKQIEFCPFLQKKFFSYKDIDGLNDKHKDKIIVIGNILREEILTIILK